MKLEQSFEVAAPLDRVWEALIDVEQVAPSLPGAAITGRNDDGSYNGTFTIKIGPTTAAYTGKLEMENVDEATRTATLSRREPTSGGRAARRRRSSRGSLPPADGATRVEVDTDYHITGRLARFGRGGMIEDISERLLREFASRLQSSLAGTEPAAQSADEYGGGSAAGEAATPPTDAGDTEPPPTEGQAAEPPTVEEPGVAAPPPQRPLHPPASRSRGSRWSPRLWQAASSEIHGRCCWRRSPCSCSCVSSGADASAGAAAPRADRGRGEPAGRRPGRYITGSCSPGDGRSRRRHLAIPSPQ